MKSIVKTINNFKKISIIKFALLYTYISIVLFSQYYAFISVDNTLFNVVNCFLIIIISIVITLFTFIITNLVSENINTYNYNSKYIINFLIIFITSFIIYNIKSFTGKLIFEPDFIFAMQQAESNTYYSFSSPVFILIFAKLPMIIFNNSLFISSFYILIRAVIISYIITNISYNLVSNIILIFYYCFMPLSIHSEMTLMKDTPCALFASISILLIFKNINNLSKHNIILIPLFLSLTYFMRPNAVVFSISMILVLFIVFKNSFKNYIKISFIFLTIILLTNFCLPKFFVINKNDKSWNMTEVMSIPASVVMAVAKEKPERLNNEEISYLKIICGEDLQYLNDFKENVGWESVKFNDSIYLRKNVPFNYSDLAYFTFDLLVREPSITIKQIIKSTSSLYGYRYIDKKRNNILSGMYYLFANIEVGLLLYFLVSSLIIKSNGILDKKLLISLPILLFSIITSLIIASPAITRYFLPLQMSLPIYIIYIFIDNNSKKCYI